MNNDNSVDPVAKAWHMLHTINIQVNFIASEIDSNCPHFHEQHIIKKSLDCTLMCLHTFDKNELAYLGEFYYYISLRTPDGRHGLCLLLA